MADHDLSPGALLPHGCSNESVALLALDRDIVAAARHQAARFPNRDYLAEELAQHARMRVLNLLRTRREPSTAYIRTTIANAVRTPPSKDLAIEHSMEIGPEIPAERREDDFLAAAVVRGWIGSLSPILRKVYDLLFVQELTQREAASQLGVSQPRIAQLRAELLAQGGRELPLLLN